MKPSPKAITVSAVKMYEALAVSASSLNSLNGPAFQEATAKLDSCYTIVESRVFRYTDIDRESPLGRRMRDWLLDQSNAYEESLTAEVARGRVAAAEAGHFVAKLDVFISVSRGELAEEYAWELLR